MSQEQAAALLNDVAVIKALLCLILGAFLASGMRPRK